MKEIHELSKEFNFKIIEDASHAIGGKYLNEPVGNCKYSDITVFSFHPVKIITTGEGGMALTNNSTIAERISILRSHGITRDPKLMTHQPDGDWYYQQIDLGFNYRMTDIQAALGVSQLERLDSYVSRRHELAMRYNKLLKNLPLIIPYQNSNNYSAFHLYIIRLKHSNKQPYYSEIDTEYHDLKQSELYYKDAISIPLYPAMTELEQDFVISSLEKALQI